MVFALDANEVSNKNRSVPISFCRSCRKKHSRDIIEIISYGGVVGGINFITYNYTSDLKQAEEKLKSLPGIDIRLDYHGVLDTVSGGINKVTNFVIVTVTVVVKLVYTTIDLIIFVVLVMLDS